ncbi:hypothetical protein LINPERPRIM_LOCUS20129 [Linum perenne]
MDGSSSLVDIHTPYHLHITNHQGQMFVPDLLHDTNYGEWSGDMVDVLLANNKFGFVNMTLVRPEDDDKELPHWECCDALVRGWLKSSMTPELRQSVCYATTPAQIWDDLKERFGRGSASCTYELRRTLILSWQEDLGVST